MKEAVFVKKNTEKWRGYEANRAEDADELTERFIEITDDLSYARTFYPNGSVTKYLNGLAAQLHQKLYANRREERSRFVMFWKYELPALMYELRPKLVYAFVFFASAFLVGWISAANDETFLRLVLGDGYVNQTLENIKKGDPLAIYASDGQADMFLRITFNNIRVSFNAIVLGVFYSIGTVYVMFSNGLMLGSFQYFFYERGLLLDSILKIWIHGTLEISAIVIAGCGGLTLGNSLIFPKTYSRLESFKQAAKQAIKLAIGLMPIFVMAGFLESFVTRLKLHPSVSGSIIGVSAAFIIWYFWIYPGRLHRQSLLPK